jgi:hypothetical protein
MHINSDGYGRGVHCVTARNVPTWPANVPQFRHPPDSERFLRGTRPTPGATSCWPSSNHRAQVRNADQMVHQTSGDYGKFLYDTDSRAVKLNKGTMNPRPSELAATRAAAESAAALGSSRGMARSSNSATQRTARSDLSARSSGGGGGAISSHRAPPVEYTAVSALRELDSAFSRKNRRDLIAATLPLRSDHELILSATSGNLQQLQSKPWAEKLRVAL